MAMGAMPESELRNALLNKEASAQASSAATSEVRDALAAARAGERLGFAQGLRLATVEGGDAAAS